MRQFVTDWEPRGIELENKALIAVGTTNRNTLIIAGPGAGKTEMLAQRASFLLETGACAAPKRILAISFKRDAAQNLRERVALRCSAEQSRYFDSRTYSGWAKGLLDRFRLALPAEYRPTEDYVISRDLGHPEVFRNRLLGLAGRAGVQGQQINNLTEIKLKGIFSEKILGQIAIPTNDFVSDLRPTLTRCWWNSVLHSQKRSTLDFSMIEVLAELLLRANPQLVAALRAAYCFVFLDEFQDTTYSQYRLLETAFKGSSSILTAVGDHKQRIMTWAGAYDKVFDEFTVSFNAEELRLVKNHRSAPRLVEIQGHFIKAFDPQSPMPIATDSGQEGEGECRVLTFTDHKAEAAYLAYSIDNWIKQEAIKPTEICVLVRQTKEGYVSELCSQLEKKKVRCRIQDEFQNLLTEPLTMAVVDAFKLCAKAQSPQNWNSLLSLVFRLRGVSNTDESTQKARKVAAEQTTFIKHLRSKMNVANTEEDVHSMIVSLLTFIDKVAFCKIHEQYLQTSFLDGVAKECAKALADARRKAINWDAALDDFIGVDTLPIMTIHKSKGLEYHTVVFVGLEDYSFFGYGKGNAVEENCNFFVAFSRAKKRVMFTFADFRPSGRDNRMQAQQREGVSNLYRLMQGAGVTIEKIDTKLLLHQVS